MEKKINVLHVDDSAKITYYIKSMLEQIPAIERIESADTSTKGKALLVTKKIDVVILDINLSGGNGIELLQWIKQSYPEIIVIMFTNYPDVYFRDATKKLGADYFLDKSFEFEKIIKIIKAL